MWQGGSKAIQLSGFSIFPTVLNQLWEQDGFSPCFAWRERAKEGAKQRSSPSLDATESGESVLKRRGTAVNHYSRVCGLITVRKVRKSKLETAWRASHTPPPLLCLLRKDSNRPSNSVWIPDGGVFERTAVSTQGHRAHGVHTAPHSEGPEVLSKSTRQLDTPFRVPRTGPYPARRHRGCHTACYRDVYAHTPCRFQAPR